MTAEEIKKIRDEIARVARAQWEARAQAEVRFEDTIKKLNEIADRLHYLATREVPQ